jgi:fluoride exporter
MSIDPNLRLPIAVSCGAIAGALGRHYLNMAISNWWGTNFPWGIFVINTTGCWLIGLLYGLVNLRVIHLSSELYITLTTGFLGAYTTFSTYGLNVIQLLEESWILGMSYAIGSAFFGIISVRLGIIMAHWFRN